jgi:ABC-type histidine transport system ATPase subunit
VIVAEGQDLGVRDVRKSYGRHEVLRGVDLPPGQAS